MRCKATGAKFGEDIVSGDFTLLGPAPGIYIVNGCLTSTDINTSTKYEFEDFKFSVYTGGISSYDEGIYKINGETQTDSLVLQSCITNVMMMKKSEVAGATYTRNALSIKFDGQQEFTFKINNADEICTIAGTLDSVTLISQNQEKKQEFSFKISVTIKTSKGVEYKSKLDYSYNMLNTDISDFTIKSISLNGKDFKPESIKESTKNALTGK